MLPSAEDVVEAVIALEGVRADAARDRPDARGREHRVRAARGVARRGPRRGTAGQPVCVVETTKATVEIEAPGAGRSFSCTARGSRSSSARRSRSSRSAPRARGRSTRRPRRSRRRRRPADRKATKKAVELAERHGIDLGSIEKRGFITEKDVEAAIARSRRRRRRRPARPSRASRRQACRSPPPSTSTRARRARPGVPRVARIPRRSARSPRTRRSTRCASAGAQIGDGVVLGLGTSSSLRRSSIEPGVAIGRTGRSSARSSSRSGAHAVRADLDLRCRRAYVGKGIGPGGRSGSGRRPPRPLGDARDRRPRVHRRRGVRERLPTRAHRPGGIPHHAVDDRHAQHRPLAARGLREPLRSGRARGPRAGRARRRPLRRRPDRRRVDRRLELVRRRGLPAGSFAIGVPAKVTGSSSTALARAPESSSRGRWWTSCTSCSRSAATTSPRSTRRAGSRSRGRASPSPRPTRRGRRPAVVLTLEVAGRSRRGRRARPARPAGARRGGGARLRARVLPQARHPARARPLALPGGPRLGPEPYVSSPSGSRIPAGNW